MKPAPVDFHCHLDLYPDPVGTVRRCREVNAYVLSVTNTPKAWRGTAALAAGVPRIRTALGLHPQIAHERAGELGLFEALLPETRYVGEIGLDGSPECKPHWREQSRVFDRILHLASRIGGRVMTIHSRRAASEVLEALARHPDAGVPVLHWFTGSKAELERAITMGCWFSVGPPMMTSKRGRELVATMPPGRVVTETDGPFAAVGKHPLGPAEVNRAVTGLATLWNMSEDEARGAVMGAFRSLVTGSPAATRQDG